MNRKLVLPLVALAIAIGGGAWWARSRGGESRWTGFVEGDERVLRSEVSARVLSVRFAEGDRVPPGAIVAELDRTQIDARLAAKAEEIAVLDTQIRSQEERIRLVEATWGRDVGVRQAAVRQSESALQLAEKSLRREQELVVTGASTAQLFDDARSRRDQAQSALDGAREALARTEAEKRQIALAERELDTLRRRRDMTAAQLAELEVQASKHTVRAPDVDTTVQAQLLWPGELAQPGTPVLSVLDPRDKYVQVYVPAGDTEKLRVGTRVEIELDARRGRRIPGEVSFVASSATFTPEKIETRGDRLGQVYRAKVRILEDVEALSPGEEGNVYLPGGPT